MEIGHLSNESLSFVLFGIFQFDWVLWIVFNYELDLCLYCISFECSFIIIIISIINLFSLLIPNSNPALVLWKEEFSNAAMSLQQSLGQLRARVTGFLRGIQFCSFFFYYYFDDSLKISESRFFS